MKFQCDRCKTRYSIADEKVRGKILKIRCKSCEAIITVRDQAGLAPVGAAAAAAVAPRVTSTGGKRAARAPLHTVNLATMSGSMVAAAVEAPAPRRHVEGTDPAALPDAQNNPEEWYLSVDGEQNGPFSAEEAQRRVARKSPSVEMFAWRDDFDEWLPVEEVPVLAVHLPRGARRATIPPLPSPPVRASEAPSPAGPAARASGSPRPGQDSADRDDDLFGVDGGQTTVSSPPEPAAEDALQLNIGEASRLVKLPIVPPAGAAASAGFPGRDARADASLQLPIASLSSELPAVRDARPSRAAPPPVRAGSETASPVPPRAGRRLGLPVIAVGVTAIGILVVVVLLAGRNGEREADRGKASAPGSVLVTDFYTKDNPLFTSARKKAAEPPPAEAAAPDSAAQPPKPAAVAVAPRPRATTSDGRAPQVRLDPASRPPTPTITSREKVDSFGDPEPQEGPLTPDDVRDTYAANEVGLKRCYERSLKNDIATPVTKMVVKITVTPNGNVSEITVPDRGTELGSCVANSIRAWRFRRSTGEFTTEFTVFFAKRG
jgi:predicted Zn finger-like uncharacterized protein